MTHKHSGLSTDPRPYWHVQHSLSAAAARHVPRPPGGQSGVRRTCGSRAAPTALTAPMLEDGCAESRVGAWPLLEYSPPLWHTDRSKWGGAAAAGVGGEGEGESLPGSHPLWALPISLSLVSSCVSIVYTHTHDGQGLSRGWGRAVRECTLATLSGWTLPSLRRSTLHVHPCALPPCTCTLARAPLHALSHTCTQTQAQTDTYSHGLTVAHTHSHHLT